MRSYDEIMADAKDKPPFSNGTEGYAWMANWCEDCTKNDEETELWCPLLSVALLGRTPVQWLEQPWQQVKGRPEGVTAPALGDTYHCTEFEERPEWPGDDDPDEGPPPDPSPPPVAEGQVDMFEVFADQIVEHIDSAVTA